MDQAPSNLFTIIVTLANILVGGACTVVSIIYGFRAAVQEFKVTLEEKLKTKIDLPEYRAKTSELHAEINKAHTQNAVQDNEIAHLKARLSLYEQQPQEA